MAPQRSRKSTALQKRQQMACAAVHSKSGEVGRLTPDRFPSWKRKVGKDVGFVVKLSQDAERLVLTRGQMLALPPGSFEAELVKRCTIADPMLKKQMRGCDLWKAV